MMKGTRNAAIAAAALILGVALVLVWAGGGGRSPAHPASNAVAILTVDPLWPAPLPDDWILGQVSGVAVDSRDHVWIVHRPGSLTVQEAGLAQDPPISNCCVPAPPVIEFDRNGGVVQAWGGPGDGYDWPSSEHGIFVDHEDNVWIGGDRSGDNQVLKFRRDGSFVLQIGRAGQTGGSNDTTRLGRPAGLWVDPESNEVYIADGYGNRRVIVFDAVTGEYRRHWGAYGSPADDDVELGPYEPDGEPNPQFRTPVHGIAVSGDGLVYVADRANNRIQVFRRSGEFVREGHIARQTRSMGAVWDIAFSHDPEQTYLYVADGSNNRLWIVRRADLYVLGSVGRGGRFPGQFMWVHNVAVDSRGNVYTSEVETGKRVQRFDFRGVRHLR